jgi:hypothetical protein
VQRKEKSRTKLIEKEEEEEEGNKLTPLALVMF